MWKPRNKYEVAPGMFVGSQIGDIDREIKGLMAKMVQGDDSVLPRIRDLSDQRMNLLFPKRLRK